MTAPRVWMWSGWMVAGLLAGILYVYVSGLDQLESGPHFHGRKVP